MKKEKKKEAVVGGQLYTLSLKPAKRPEELAAGSQW